MKTFALVLITGLVSSAATILGYTYLVEPKTQYVVQDVPVRQANFADGERVTYASSLPTSFTDAAEAVTPSVVNIRATTSSGGMNWLGYDGGYDSGVSTGSGVVISSDGYIVTNNHVIEGAKEIEVVLSNRRNYEAKLIGTDPSTDLALLKIKAEDLPYLNFGDSDGTRVGEWVLAVGNPFNLTSTVTAGIISAKGRDIQILDDAYAIESFIQTDAVVNPGNSGGALVNTKGDLIGVNTAIITRSGRYEGYSFAVPANIARKVVSDLREYGKVQRGLLGVGIQNIDERLAERLGLPDLDGVYITRVNDGGAAGDAGLQSGDVIVAVNGIAVASSPGLQEQVARYRPGNRIEITYIRDGKRATTKVTLKNQNNTTTLSTKSKNKTLQALGAELRNLSRDESRRMRVKGAMVVSILRGSVIERTNMDPGYIITKVNDKPVRSVEDVIKAIENARGLILLEGVYENYPNEYYYRFDKSKMK